MLTDEQAIRTLLDEWHCATAASEIERILPLMCEDIVFLVSGQAPFGREVFEKNLRSLFASHRIESSGEIKELEISGDIAYCWSFLNVRIAALIGGEPMMRSGHVLSILRKNCSGAWQLARDANLLAAH